MAANGWLVATMPWRAKVGERRDGKASDFMGSILFLDGG